MLEHSIYGRRASGYLVALLCMIVIAQTPLIRSQEKPKPSACDSTLTGVSNPNTRYSYCHNSDRCEGLFERKESAYGCILELVGVAFGRPKYEFYKHMVLKVRVPETVKDIVGPFRIRAVPVVWSVPYQMDAFIRRGEEFLWPVDDRLAPSKLSYDLIGLHCVVEYAPGSSAFLPLLLYTNEFDRKALMEGGVLLTYRPMRPLSSFKWRAYSLGAKPPDYGEPISTDKYANEPVLVRLDRGLSGLIRVDFAPWYKGKHDFSQPVADTILIP